MTTWIESSNTKQDGSPVTRRIKIPEMDQEIWFTTNAFAEVADDVADILANNIDSISKLGSAPSDPGDYYGDAGANTTVEIVVSDGAFDNLTVQSMDADVIGTDKVGYTGNLNIGFLGDSHYNEAGGRNYGDIVDQTTWESNVSTVIDEMNAANVDVIVQLGDLVDYPASGSASEQQSWTSTAVNFVEDRADAPVIHLIGNHEQGYSGSQGTDYLYDALGFSGDSDTYGVFEVGGFDLVFLNTAYSETDWSTNDSDHGMPPNQLDWLRDYLSENNKPKIVTMHIPSIRAMDSAYDSFTNEQEVTELLNSDPSVQYVVYGHVHHGSDGMSSISTWDRVRELIKPSNVIGETQKRGWLHVCTPHVLGTDTSVSPWADVSGLRTGQQTLGYASTNYSHSTYPTEWQIGAETQSAGETHSDLVLNGEPIVLNSEYDRDLIKTNDDIGVLYIQSDPDNIGRQVIGFADTGIEEFVVRQDRADFNVSEIRYHENEQTQIKGSQFMPQSSPPNTFNTMTAVADGVGWDPTGNGNAALVSRGPDDSWEVIHEFSGPF